MAEIEIINPETMTTPLGAYSQLARVKTSELVFIAGQVATNKAGATVGVDNFEKQCEQTYANIEAALKAVGASWGNVVQFTSYLVNPRDIAKFAKWRSQAYPTMFPNRAYPPNTLLIIDRLLSEEYLVEVQAIAAL